MKIIEARDGFIKIESTEKVDISDFLQIKSSEKTYVAQVVRVKSTGTGYGIYAKILFIYDIGLKKYDKTLPNRESEVSEFPFDKISELFQAYEPIISGKFISHEEDIPIDRKFYNNDILVSVDNQELLNAYISNVSKQFNETGKVYIIDTLGIIEGEKYTAGIDFKLPINESSLKFIYEDCLNDATSDSKSLIKEIFADLCEYSKTVNFVPFDVLKSVVDDMVDKSHIFKLLVLKNKLAKFEKLGYFAANSTDANYLSEILDNNNIVKIDLSKLDPLFLNRYLQTIYSEINNISGSKQVFTIVSNYVNKLNLKEIVTNKDIPSVFITHSKFKYLKEIKQMFKNYILESTFANREIFKLYSLFLESLNSNYMLIVGEGTDYIPVISKKIKFLVPKKTKSELEQEKLTKELEELSDIDNLAQSTVPDKSSESVESAFDTDNLQEEVAEEEVIEPTDNIKEEVTEEEVIEPEDSISEEFAESKEFENGEISETQTQEDNLTSIEVPSELDNDISLSETEEDLSFSNDLNESLQDEDTYSPEVLPINDDNSDFDEIVELDETDADSDTILVDLDDNDSDISENNSVEDIDKEIVSDVDKVFTTMKDDEISESDLDFIDELNEYDSTNDEENLFGIDDSQTLEELAGDDDSDLDENFTEPLQEISDSNKDKNEPKEILETRNTGTPIVPVYEAEIPQEDRVVSDPIEQGDTVVHAKYGTGIVEKMIKYGTKNLFSINFENVGRRLLDPTLTEIKKA